MTGAPQRERPEEDRANPLRRCAITRNRRPREALLRFVADGAGLLVEDLAGRLPGRGIYVLPEAVRVTALLAKHKMVGEARDAVLGRLAAGLTRRLLDALGLAKRAGGCVTGQREVEELLKHGRKPLLLLATDAGAGARERLEHLMHGNERVEVLEVLNQEQLGTIRGGRLVTVAAVTNPGLGERIRIDAARWRSFMQVAEPRGEGSVERVKRQRR
ncbi:MAG: DUF448 domain-containing protein [Magnetococcales bacterium]|nr:DUF448 domain-containing protein [Magnetococcales bacterium]